MLTAEEATCLATFKAHADGTAPDCHVCKQLGGHAIKVYPEGAKKLAACIERMSLQLTEVGGNAAALAKSFRTFEGRAKEDRPEDWAAMDEACSAVEDPIQPLVAPSVYIEVDATKAVAVAQPPELPESVTKAIANRRLAAVMAYRGKGIPGEDEHYEHLLLAAIQQFGAQQKADGVKAAKERAIDICETVAARCDKEGRELEIKTIGLPFVSGGRKTIDHGAAYCAWAIEQLMKPGPN